MMDEDFVQIYLNKMAGRVNELQQENILLKSQLEHANMQMQKREQSDRQQEDLPIENAVASPEVLPVEKTERIIPKSSSPGKKESLADRIRREQRGE